MYSNTLKSIKKYIDKNTVKYINRWKSCTKGGWSIRESRTTRTSSQTWKCVWQNLTKNWMVPFLIYVYKFTHADAINYFTVISPSHLLLVLERIYGVTTNVWQEKHIFVYLSESVQFFNPRQILFAVPLKIVPSRTKFVKSRQTIRICYYTAYSSNLKSI